LNVATTIDDAPAEVRRLAVSLSDLQSAPASPGQVEHLFRAILQGFATDIERLAHDDPDLPARWGALDTLLDRPIRVDLGTRILPGSGRGIDHEGALCLATDEGVVRVFGGRVLRDPPDASSPPIGSSARR